MKETPKDVATALLNALVAQLNNSGVDKYTIDVIYKAWTKRIEEAS